jgi:DNA-directed RNA polymerase alpha subunit
MIHCDCCKKTLTKESMIEVPQEKMPRGILAISLSEICLECSYKLNRLQAVAQRKYWELLTASIKELLADPAKDTSFIEELNVSPRVYNLLKSAGIYSFGDLCKLEESELLAISGLGGCALREIRTAMRQKQLSLTKSKPLRSNKPAHNKRWTDETMKNLLELKNTKTLREIAESGEYGKVTPQRLGQVIRKAARLKQRGLL